MLAGVDPHTTPIGDWCDAAWAEHTDFILSAYAAGGEPALKKLDEDWGDFTGAPTGPAMPVPARPADAPVATSSPTPTPRPGQVMTDVPVDPETGQPRRPTKAERDAWAVQSAAAGTNDLMGATAAGGRSGAAERVGG